MFKQNICLQIIYYFYDKEYLLLVHIGNVVPMIQNVSVSSKIVKGK